MVYSLLQSSQYPLCLESLREIVTIIAHILGVPHQFLRNMRKMSIGDPLFFMAYNIEDPQIHTQILAADLKESNGS